MEGEVSAVLTRHFDTCLVNRYLVDWRAKERTEILEIFATFSLCAWPQTITPLRV
jgi:hypothetical protein